MDGAGPGSRPLVPECRFYTTAGGDPEAGGNCTKRLEELEIVCAMTQSWRGVRGWGVGGGGRRWKEDGEGSRPLASESRAPDSR